MPKIIALTGAKGSGKDTVAGIIKSKYDNVATVAFADPIKNVIQHIFNLDPTNNDEYDRLKRSDFSVHSSFKDTEATTTWKHIPGRHVVREIGMLMRSYNEKQFTEYVEDQFRQYPDKLWVITDLRFDNEYTMLKKWNAKIIKINRPRYEYDGHITERGFDDHLVHKIILNDGSMEYLNTRVDVVMESLIKEWQ